MRACQMAEIPGGMLLLQMVPGHVTVPLSSRGGAEAAPSRQVAVKALPPGPAALLEETAAVWRRARVYPRLTVVVGASGVDAPDVAALLAATGQNCDLFPALDAAGRPLPVDSAKLRRAIDHSFVVVAIYLHGRIPGGEGELLPGDAPPPREGGDGGSWQRHVAGAPRRQLVAFGRASSDTTLTASIHDLAVHPALQGIGIGRKLLHHIVRELRRRDVLDIAALAPSQQLRFFFRACGFARDRLGSTTMTYTRAVPARHSPPEGHAARSSEESQTVPEEGGQPGPSDHSFQGRGEAPSCPEALTTDGESQLELRRFGRLLLRVPAARQPPSPPPPPPPKSSSPAVQSAAAL